MVSGETRTTPAQFELKRKHSYLVKVTKEGYEPAETMVNNKLDWTAWADIFIWGVIPVFADLATGAAYKLSPEEISVSLQKTPTSSLDGPDEIPVRLTVRGERLSIQTPDSGSILNVTVEQVK